MSPKYKKGEKVRVYHPTQSIFGIVSDIKQSGGTWLYSLSDPETGEIHRVHFGGSFGNSASQVNWQEERWLHPC